MKALLDTCVIMDAVQNREPFARDAQAVFLVAANETFMGLVTAKAMTDIYYLIHRCTHDIRKAETVARRIGMPFGILDTTESDVRRALASDLPDFEDSVMVETALRENMDCIVTRNLSDYQNAPLPVYAPQAFLDRLHEMDD